MNNFYYHVTGRPPTARTDVTDRNMIFYLRHQLRWDQQRIDDFMHGLPQNTNEPHEPWGRQMMHPVAQADNADDGFVDGGDDFAGGNDFPFEPPDEPVQPPNEPVQPPDEPVQPPNEPVQPAAPAAYQGRREVQGPVRRSRRLNQRASKKKAIESIRTKRARLVYKLLFGR